MFCFFELIMWFKKKKVIDLTEKRPKLRIMPKVSSSNVSSYNDNYGYTDLTNSTNNTSSSSSNTSGNALGFLGNLAGASSSFNANDDVSNEIMNIHDSNLHFKDMIRKLDDFEFKLDSINRKVDALIDRVDVAEKKVNRLEGRN